MSSRLVALVAGVLISTSAFAGEDRSATIEFMVGLGTTDPMKGFAIRVGRDNTEMHVAHWFGQRKDTAIGLGLSARSEGDGQEDNRDFAASGTVGVAYLVNGGFKPYFRTALNADVRTDGDAEFEVSYSRYGVRNYEQFLGLGVRLNDRAAAPVVSEAPVVDASSQDAADETVETTSDETPVNTDEPTDETPADETPVVDETPVEDTPTSEDPPSEELPVDDGNNGHGNDEDGNDESNPGNGGGSDPPVEDNTPPVDEIPPSSDDGNNGHGNDDDHEDDSNPGNGDGPSNDEPPVVDEELPPSQDNDGNNGHGNDDDGVDESNPGHGPKNDGEHDGHNGHNHGPNDDCNEDDGNNGHGNDNDHHDESNPGKGKKGK